MLQTPTLTLAPEQQHIARQTLCLKHLSSKG